MRGWVLAAVAMLTVTVSAQEARTSGSLERPFAANGLVKMDLVAADYRVNGSAQDRVRIDWSVHDAQALAKGPGTGRDPRPGTGDHDERSEQPGPEVHHRGAEPIRSVRADDSRRSHDWWRPRQQGRRAPCRRSAHRRRSARRLPDR